jgi:hypothetical protein
MYVCPSVPAIGEPLQAYRFLLPFRSGQKEVCRSIFHACETQRRDGSKEGHEKGMGQKEVIAQNLDPESYFRSQAQKLARSLDGEWWERDTWKVNVKQAHAICSRMDNCCPLQ